MATNPILPDESYYTNARTTETERLNPGALLLRAADTMLPARPAPLLMAVVLIAAGAMRLGWLLRELSAMPYTIEHLAWLIPLACFLVAWGNRRGVE